jgi:hypothetical protein
MELHLFLHPLAVVHRSPSRRSPREKWQPELQAPMEPSAAPASSPPPRCSSSPAGGTGPLPFHRTKLAA